MQSPEAGVRRGVELEEGGQNEQTSGYKKKKTKAVIPSVATVVYTALRCTGKLLRE